SPSRKPGLLSREPGSPPRKRVSVGRIDSSASGGAGSASRNHKSSISRRNSCARDDQSPSRGAYSQSGGSKTESRRPISDLPNGLSAAPGTKRNPKAKEIEDGYKRDESDQHVQDGHSRSRREQFSVEFDGALRDGADRLQGQGRCD